MRKNPIYDEYEYAERQLHGILVRIGRLDMSIARLEKYLVDQHYQTGDKVYKNVQRLKEARKVL